MAKSKPGINNGGSPRFDAEQLALQLHLNISHRQVAGLKELAQVQDRTVSYLIRAAIEAMLTANQAENG